MFIGHFGLGLAGKAAVPRVSLGTWFLSVQLLDLLWPIFLLLGWEHVRVAPGITRMTPLDFYDYPITHSLVGALGWSVLLAALYGLAAGRAAGRGAWAGAVVGWQLSRPAVAGLLGLGVFSHWLLDLVVHRADLPLLPRGPYVGLGLWNVPAAAMPIEAAMYLGGAALYLRATRPRRRSPAGPPSRVGRYGTWLLLLALPAAWLAATLGPPPPGTGALAWGGLSMWLFVLWAWWCDRHREPRPCRE